MRGFIVLGDATSHGGRVITADFTTLVNGKPMACVGHLTVCPKCKGTFPIASGAEDMMSMGAPPARHGDKTACGATLIAGQQITTWSNQSQMGDPAAAKADALTLAQTIATPAPAGICLECLAKAARAGAAAVIR